MSKKKQPAPPSLDLFGEIPCTWSDCAAWCLAVPGIAPDSPRFAAYVRGYNVIDKVRRAIAERTFFDTLREGFTQANRLSLGAIQFFQTRNGSALLNAVQPIVRPIDIASQVAQFYAQAAPGHQAARQAARQGDKHIEHDLSPLGDRNRPRSKNRRQTIGQQVILGRQKKLADLRQGRQARVRASLAESISKPSHDLNPLENRTKKPPRRASKACVPSAPLADRPVTFGFAGLRHPQGAPDANDHPVNRPQDTARSRSPDRLSRARETAPAHDENEQSHRHQPGAGNRQVKKISVHVKNSTTPLGSVRV